MQRVTGLACDCGGMQHVGVEMPPEPSTSDRPHTLQVKAWQEMGGAGRVALTLELGQKARGWKRDALRAQHPEWSDDQIERELARIWLRAYT